ncbi:MAG: VWA domain-containing protein [Acidobacteria bacterium]|nr:VWA domain-containing protein [Acidobacteriota bacterium]
MRVRTLFAILGLAALAASGAAAQGRPVPVERDPAPTFRSGVEMVTVRVSVRDRNGRIVRDLSRDDFRLIDSGFGRPIESVFASDSALSVAVLVDISGSMAIDRNIDRARRAVEALVDSLQSGRDELALFTFDTVLREIAPFTSDLARIGVPTLTESPFGQTSLYDAVADAATLVGRRGNRHRALLVVTDGVDNGSLRTAGEVSSVASAIAVPVHVMTVGGPLDRRDGIGGAAGADGEIVAASLADLARWTGGSVRATGTRDDLLAALAELLTGLRYQYVLTFQPGFRRGWHPIEIRTADDNLVVHARGGYVAGRARLKW